MIKPSDLISVEKSAEVLRVWLEPIEQILIDHGWTRVTDMPNVWVNQKGEMSFLAEALRGLIAATAQSEARITELKAELRRVYAEIRQPIAVSYSDFLSSAPDWARTLAEG